MNKSKERNAVRRARELESQALDCITIAEHLLPNAEADVVESQAVDFMGMPLDAVRRTLQRIRSQQENLRTDFPEVKEEIESKLSMQTRFQILKAE